MLSVEEIKRAYEFADGFELSKDRNAIISNGECFYMSKLYVDIYAWKNVYYPLFLQRVKQGLNKRRTINYRIDILGINLYIIDEIANQVISRHDPYYDNDEGLEQAIKYILGDIK